MKNNFLLVSNPGKNIPDMNLPGAVLEINSIMEIIKQKSNSKCHITILECDEASKRKFIEEINEHLAIIHFAGHGEYNTTDPWLSSLIFFPEDGYSNYSITDMLLNPFKQTPLFILSACDTARSRYRRGDEIDGMIRGLTLAGATSIIATNWIIDDKIAPLFMKNFYECFLNGEIFAKSLYHARKRLFKCGNKNPFDWGVYEAFGNPFKRLKLDQ